MKTATIIFGALILAATVETARADVGGKQLSPDFVGNWCAVAYAGNVGTAFKRLATGRQCKQNAVEGSGLLRVRSDGFSEVGQKDCALIRILGKRDYPGLFRCREGATVLFIEYFIDLDGRNNLWIRTGEIHDRDPLRR